MSGSVLKDNGLYKNRIISVFLESSDILELMLGRNYTQDAADNIVYEQIFPYLYVDDTQTDVKSYLCVEVDTPIIPTGTIKNMRMTIWSYCHKSCMKYVKQGYMGTRADILADMVERALRQSEQNELQNDISHVDTGYGIGKLHLDSVTYFYPNTKYYGKQLIFTTSDFKIKAGSS